MPQNKSLPTKLTQRLLHFNPLAICVSLYTRAFQLMNNYITGYIYERVSCGYTVN